MASEIYRKNRSWLFADIKEHLPEVISCLCDEGILSPNDREEISLISQQTDLLLDAIRKKIITSRAPFEFAIKFAQALKKTSVSSGGLADFEDELEKRQNTVASRKNSLDSSQNRGASDSSSETQSSSPRQASTDDVGLQEMQVLGRRKGVSESSSSDDPSSRRSSAGSDSGVDQSSPGHVVSIRRQLSKGLQPIKESEANVGVPEKFEDDAFEGVSMAPEEYIETKVAESSLPSPEVCSEPIPIREEMPVVRKLSVHRYDRFVDSVLKAAQEFCQEDKQAASKEFHEMEELYCKHIQELEGEVSSLRCNLKESEKHIKDVEHEKALHTKNIQEKERKISRREEELEGKERELKRMKEDLEEMQSRIKRTETEVDRFSRRLSSQPGNEKLASIKRLVDLLESADDPGTIKTAITHKMNTLKFGERPGTSHM